jgi:hypothetical protein
MAPMGYFFAWPRPPGDYFADLAELADLYRRHLTKPNDVTASPGLPVYPHLHASSRHRRVYPRISSRPHTGACHMLIAFFVVDPHPSQRRIVRECPTASSGAVACCACCRRFAFTAAAMQSSQ